MSSFVSFGTGGSMLSGRGVLAVGVWVPILGPFELGVSPSGTATPPSTIGPLLTAGELGRERVVGLARCMGKGDEVGGVRRSIT